MSLDWDKFKVAFAGYVSSNRAPCSDGYGNQCALRLSHSLVDAGWPFNGPRQPYTQGPLCTHSKARGAQSLADYLERYLVKPKIYKKKADPKSGIMSSKPGEYEILSDGSTNSIPFLTGLTRRPLRVRN